MVLTKEMQSFLGVLLLTGYHSLLEEHHYWSTQPDLGVPAVYNTISRNRYHEIKDIYILLTTKDSQKDEQNISFV